MNMMNFYDFLSENTDYNLIFNVMDKNMQESVISFIGKSNPQTNINEYYSAVMTAAQYPNGLKNLNLQIATDGLEAQNAVNKMKNQYAVYGKVTQQAEILKEYITNCRHDDLKYNFSLIPDYEKDNVLKKAVIEHNGHINSKQLRDFVYREAQDYYKEAHQYDNIEIHINTNHAEDLGKYSYDDAR